MRNTKQSVRQKCWLSVLFFILGVISSVADGQTPQSIKSAGTTEHKQDAKPQVWPADDWLSLDSPASAGWSKQGLEQARQTADRIGSEAVAIVQDGYMVQHWGDIDRAFPVYSIRKSLLGALLGQLIAEELITLDQTLGDLGIDDHNFSLNDAEKLATIHDLITSRSGVYHKAAYEAAEHAKNRPARGSHPPGKFFFYNNWDFNVLGTIVNRKIGGDLFDEFKRRIAEPLKFQDFSLEDTDYRDSSASLHPAYLFKMSARDLARFGLLYLRGGKWRDDQLIATSWIQASTKTQVRDALPHRSYGYLWWTYPKYGDHYAATGSGGQMLVIEPNRRIVIAHLASENVFGRGGVSKADFWKLYGQIMAAAPSPAESR